MSTQTKLIIQMSGAPGSGKSTVARLLRPCIDAVIIDHDVLRSSLLASASDIPFDQAAKQAYCLQWALAQDVMKQDMSVIVDSTCNYPEVLKQGSYLAAQYGYTYCYVECKVDDIDLLDRRLRARPPMESQRSAVDSPPPAAKGVRGGEDSRALFAKWIHSPCRPESGHVIVVDSTAPPEFLRDEILKKLSIAKIAS